MSRGNGNVWAAGLNKVGCVKLNIQLMEDSTTRNSYGDEFHTPVGS